MSTDFNETPGAARYRKMSDNKLGQLWKNPIFKLSAIVILVAGVSLAAVNLMKSRNPELQSALPVSSSNKTIVGEKDGVTPEYARAVQELDQTRAEEARDTGASALPTPITNPVATPTVDMNAEGEDGRDPLSDFERMLTESKAPPPASIPEPQPTVSPEAIQALVRAYRAQMDMLMTQWTPQAMTIVNGAEVAPVTRVAAESGPAQPAGEGRVIVQAGTVNYAQMLLEANSDIPGPIMAQILTGPLAGGRAIGSFETFRNHLVIRFNTVTLRNRQLTVDILALNPDSTLGGLATEVDPRYMTRVLLPAAAEFVQAFGDTLAEPSSTTTVSGSGGNSVTTNNSNDRSPRDAFFKGVGAAADRVSQFADEEAAATKRLVRVAPGTPVGMFFVTPVTEQ